jgi:hypothetical protein
VPVVVRHEQQVRDPLAGGGDGLVAAGEAKIFDLAFVRLAQLVDFLACPRVDAPDRVRDVVQAEQLDEVL